MGRDKVKTFQEGGRVAKDSETQASLTLLGPRVGVGVGWDRRGQAGARELECRAGGWIFLCLRTGASVDSWARPSR